MLLNDFYTYEIIEFAENTIKANVTLIKNHKIYEGHFPQQPVTPGVCQVQIIKEIISGVLNKQVVMKKAKDIKYTTMINPLEVNELEIELVIKEEDDVIKTIGTIKKDQIVFTKIRCEFHEA